MLSTRRLFFFLSIVTTGLVAGCQPDEKITRERRPRLNNYKRLLAAIVLPEKNPEGQKTWFFKIVGSETEIEPLVAPFNVFVRSIRFANPEQPTWQLPQGWTEQKDKDNKMRYATIMTGPNGAPAVSVTALAGEGASSVPANVIRWRVRDLGLKGDVLGAADLEDFYRYESVGDGHVAVIVDMIGPGPRGEAEPADALDRHGTDDVPFKYDVPPGWSVVRPTSNLHILAFRALGKDKKADINVSVFPGGGGGILANVNRWRKQLGLAELTPAQIKDLPEVKIGTAKGNLVDITGLAMPPDRNRVIGAILMRDRDSLFVKMTGPNNFVGEQKPALESFLKSIQFRAEK